MIVLVDDNPAHRHLVKRAIKRAFEGPTEVVEFASFRQGLSFLVSGGKNPPALFIVDLNLGDGRGTDLAREIKMRWIDQPPPILLLSTSRLEQDLADADSAGVSDYIVKDEDPEKFTAQVVAGVQKLFG